MSKATSLGRLAAVGIFAMLLSAGALHAADPDSSSTPMSSAWPPASPTTGPLLEWEQTITSQEPRGWLSEVVVWSGGFAILGRDETGNNTVWTSRDGRSWTADHLPIPKRREPAATTTSRVSCHLRARSAFPSVLDASRLA